MAFSSTKAKLEPIGDVYTHQRQGLCYSRLSSTGAIAAEIEIKFLFLLQSVALGYASIQISLCHQFGFQFNPHSKFRLLTLAVKVRQSPLIRSVYF
ncbi:unnamed protein product [Calicophoron daubneyi]|uniref:Uncharacterized protein n=1 Tax=Calicophoron daubneyi TaxID=300641 RepID=A0AAV2TNY9_CALDB